MSKTCKICNNRTIFFVWSSTRDFPVEKLLDEKDLKVEKEGLKKGRIAFPICYKCAKELGYSVV